VHVKCAFDHAFPENVIASALRHVVKVSRKKRVWKACSLAGLANLRKTKRECSHITRVLTPIAKKWDKENNTKRSLLRPIVRCSLQAQRNEAF